MVNTIQVTTATSLDKIGLNKRSLNPLLAGGYRTVGDVLSVKAKAILSCPNMGPHWFNNVLETLRKYGFELESMAPVSDVSKVKQSSIDVVTGGVSIKGEFLATGLKSGQTLSISITVKD